MTIGAIEQFITETAWDEGWVRPLAPRKERAASVGIIGAGPAGLAAAEQLREEGYRVTIYDRHDRAGGLLIYGIPNFKLEKYLVMRRTERLRKGGVEFVLNFEVGRDATLEDLRARHDAVLIACGFYKARDLACPGIGNGGVEAALDYLIASNRKGLGDHAPHFDSGRFDARGKNVVVIGGGDTAMDCVRTAVRQGARSVVCLYRRDRANMPGSLREVARAEEEGVRFEWLAGPRAVLGDAAAAAGVRAIRIGLGGADASGRLAPTEVPGTDFELPAELVLKALGFDAEPIATLFAAPRLAMTKRGSLKVHPSTFETSVEGVFAAGDIVRGSSLVVWAIHDGRKAAASIATYLDVNAKAIPAARASA